MNCTLTLFFSLQLLFNTHSFFATSSLLHIYFHEHIAPFDLKSHFFNVFFFLHTYFDFCFSRCHAALFISCFIALRLYLYRSHCATYWIGNYIHFYYFIIDNKSSLSPLTFSPRAAWQTFLMAHCLCVFVFRKRKQRWPDDLTGRMPVNASLS